MLFLRYNPCAENLSHAPGQAGQWVRLSSRYTKVAGSIPSQGTYKKLPMNVSRSGTTHGCLSVSLPFPISL